MSVIYVHQSHCTVRLHENQILVCSDDRERLACIPEMQAERIVVVGNASLTTPLIKRCLSNGIEIIYTTESGHYLGRTMAPGSRAQSRQVHQIRLFSDASACLSWSKAILLAKHRGTMVELRRLLNNGWVGGGEEVRRIQQAGDLVPAAASTAQLMGLEALMAKDYYALFAQALPAGWEWSGRQRRPPPDPVNALLSLTSSFMTQRLVSGCYRYGLEPGVGFLHALGYNRPGLALDLLEPLRCLVCDHFVLKSLRCHKFKSGDFVQEDGSCRLSDVGFRAFTAAYEADQSQPGKRRESPAVLLERILEATRKGVDSGQAPAYQDLLSAR